MNVQLLLDHAEPHTVTYNEKKIFYNTGSIFFLSRHHLWTSICFDLFKVLGREIFLSDEDIKYFCTIGFI